MSTPPPEISDEQSQAFWRATEAALEVNDRYQFFVWLRLHLHRFIPHDLALCMLGGSLEDGAHVQVFHSVPVIDTLLRDFPNARSRWWRDIGEHWQRQGRRAIHVPLGEFAATRETIALRADGYRSLLVHGFETPTAASAEEAMQSLFVFALRAGTPDEHAVRTGIHMNLWLPILYCTAIRALPVRSPSCASNSAMPRGGGGIETPLTKREIQVLAAVREARQNSEIGKQLGISPLTVKNHLRTIMRKLNARNRAQAVAEAMARRLIS